MLGSEAESSVVALEEHTGLTGLLFPQLAGHVVVGADDFRDCLSFPEGDADGVLALLTAAGESQVGRIVRVAEGEAPLAPLLETERRAALVFVDLPDDPQCCSGCHCLDHAATASCRATATRIIAAGVPSQEVRPITLTAAARASCD